MMLDDPEYAAQVRYDSDAEILRRLLHIACVSDRLDTDLVGERVPILVGELERRGCHTDPGWAEIVKEIGAAAHRTDHPALTAAAKALGLRRPRAVRFDCPLCMRPRLRNVTPTVDRAFCTFSQVSETPCFRLGVEGSPVQIRPA
jgi:hypothetical protein